jgi:hypothetical protein
LVAERLNRLLPAVRSVHFPSLRELRLWDGATTPLYRVEGSDPPQVGPRLMSLWATSFCPVQVLALEPTPTGTRLVGRRRLPTVTLALLLLWVATLTGWAAFSLSQPDAPPWLPFWSVLAGGTVAGAALGWTLGGRALDEGLAWLATSLAADEQEILRDDW